MELVIIESPYASGATDGAEGKVEDVARNRAYLQQCIRDSILRGEAPFASHQMYTDALSDLRPEERAKGISAGLHWGKHAVRTVVYIDCGVSPGMEYGISDAHKNKRAVEYRQLSEWTNCLHIRLSTAAAVARYRCLDCKAEWTGIVTVPAGFRTWREYVADYSRQLDAMGSATTGPALLLFDDLTSKLIPPHLAAQHVRADILLKAARDKIAGL